MCSINQTIDLKRIIMVKAIITKNFIENLVSELNRALKNVKIQEQQMEEQAKMMAEDFVKNNQMQQLIQLQQNVSMKKAELIALKNDLNSKISEAINLELGSEYNQGPLEGFVSVSLGDNLYQKVGAAEIVVKDGYIMEIRNVEEYNFVNVN